MHMAVHFVQALVVLMRSLQMKTVLAALRGRPVLRVKLEAKSVVANLWMLMDGGGAKA